jgi:hypothetical protein
MRTPREIYAAYSAMGFLAEQGESLSNGEWVAVADAP